VKLVSTPLSRCPNIRTNVSQKRPNVCETNEAPDANLGLDLLVPVQIALKLNADKEPVAEFVAEAA
jgi:hypothetical protein